MEHQPVFLTAQWRHLLMLNYEVESHLLEPYLPAGTQLDYVRGSTYVSLVGFRFLDTRLKGWRIPGHQNFDEVNLRFYVRRPHLEGHRRGVVFIKEIVPRFWVAAIANTIYHENYAAHSMRHQITCNGDGLCAGAPIEYAWRAGGRWHRIGAEIAGPAVKPMPTSDEQFITEHYWGYSRTRDGMTIEYEVAHPPWQVYPVRDPRCEIDVARLYGAEFATALSGAPSSAFVADGSAVSVHRGTRVTYDAGTPVGVKTDDGEADAAWATA